MKETIDLTLELDKIPELNKYVVSISSHKARLLLASPSNPVPGFEKSVFLVTQFGNTSLSRYSAIMLNGPVIKSIQIPRLNPYKSRYLVANHDLDSLPIYKGNIGNTTLLDNNKHKNIIALVSIGSKCYFVELEGIFSTMEYLIKLNQKYTIDLYRGSSNFNRNKINKLISEGKFLVHLKPLHKVLETKQQERYEFLTKGNQSKELQNSESYQRSSKKVKGNRSFNIQKESINELVSMVNFVLDEDYQEQNSELDINWDHVIYPQNESQLVSREESIPKIISSSSLYDRLWVQRAQVSSLVKKNDKLQYFTFYKLSIKIFTTPEITPFIDDADLHVIYNKIDLSIRQLTNNLEEIRRVVYLQIDALEENKIELNYNNLKAVEVISRSTLLLAIDNFIYRVDKRLNKHSRLNFLKYESVTFYDPESYTIVILIKP